MTTLSPLSKNDHFVTFEQEWLSWRHPRAGMALLAESQSRNDHLVTSRSRNDHFVTSRSRHALIGAGTPYWAALTSLGSVDVTGSVDVQEVGDVQEERCRAG